ncbi:ROK family transcriptional regulator [Microbacterium sp. SD291]|uniref:ROK family transcriptional regulator n=1 Tax=Microbacterium sp. SD291 TaxID=2782007 RepID=UPI001A95F642|nr:ROK family transcriptional regulator [Microbacterium sp. SD291]MBO0980335.1 ROK family transcriptional regulator [Microbacterium sp. SD291]
MKTGTEATVARTVLIHGPISRSALAVRLGMSPASLTRLTKPFVDRGILIELDDVVDGVGRPSRPLDVSPGVGAFLGVKLTASDAHVVLTDVRAQLLGEVVLPLESHEPSTVVGTIVDAMGRLVGDGARPAGIGISVGGVTDGISVVWGPYLEWEGVPLGELVTAATGLPVRIENDVIALTEAERWFGVVRGVEGFTVVTIGVGVGYGVVSGGEVVRNVDSGVSLAAHIPLEPHGPLCPEGHRGCAQAMLGSGSIAAQATAALQRPVGYDEVLSLAVEGDPAASAIVDASARALGRLIALSANLTLHADVVLAGEGMGLFAIAEDAVRAAIVALRDPRASEVRLHVDDSGFTAWARGAAAVAVQDAFERM